MSEDIEVMHNGIRYALILNTCEGCVADEDTELCYALNPHCMFGIFVKADE